MLWEGLFYSKFRPLLLTLLAVMWHSDKLVYQKQCAEKISSLMKEMKSKDHKQKWFDQFLYIFNLHWNKVDNFRIDKYLMLLRMMFHQVLTFLKSSGYTAEPMAWYQTSMFTLFNSQQMGDSASGIPLQICDIFV